MFLLKCRNEVGIEASDAAFVSGFKIILLVGLIGLDGIRIE